MRKIHHVFYNFSGGLNTDKDPDHIAENELVVADNCDLGERGGMTIRKGTVRINQQSYEAQVEQIFEWPGKANLAVFGYKVGDEWEYKLHRIHPGGSAEFLQDVKSPKLGFFFYADKLYFLDGDEYYCYDTLTVAPVPSSAEPDCDLGPIRKCRFAVRHPKSFRIFFAGNPDRPEAIYYSEPGEPGYVKEVSMMVPTTGEGEVTGLALFMDAVMVFYKHSLWVWRGVDPDSDAIWEKLPTSEGTVAPHTVALTTNSLTYLGQGGLWALSPNIIGISMEVALGKEYIANLAEGRVENLLRSIYLPEVACAAFDSRNQRYLLAYCDIYGGGRNNYILVYEDNVFRRYTNIRANDIRYMMNGEVWIATENYILRFGEGYQDAMPDGTDAAIRMEVVTPAYHLGMPFHRKRIHRVYSSFQNHHGPGHGFHMEVLVDGKVLLDKDQDVPPGADETVQVRNRVYGVGKRLQVHCVHQRIGKQATIYGIGLDFHPVHTVGEYV